MAPPAKVTVTVPFATPSCTVLKLPSTSLTLSPPSASAVSSVHHLRPRHRVHRRIVDGVPVMALTPVIAGATPSLTLVAMVKLLL